jgi:hypothetical protein
MEEKQALETIARDKSMTMTEFMKEWILKGDVVTVFTLQLARALEISAILNSSSII